MISVIKKISLTITPLVALPLVTLLLLSRLAQAQDVSPTDQEPDASPWYQIEVFIFAYERPMQETETWPSDLGLKYPQRIISLQAAPEKEVVLNTLLNEQPDAESYSTEQAPGLTSAKPTDETAAAVSDTEANSESAPLTPEPVTVELEEQPFTLLPEEELQLSTIAEKLLRQRDIRKLFHAAWRQPIGPRDDSESILIRGGDPYDNHFELEGSINFGLERYLHISTDLWLSSFVSNVGGLQNPWPVLPPLPVASSLLSGQSINLSFEEAPLPGLTGTGASAMTSSGTQSAASNPTVSQSTASSSTVKQATVTPGLNFKALEFDNLFADLAIQKYSVERTVTMRQQRRMRSTELHYLDHPLMGLLVKIIPYERPEPETADSEQLETEASTTNDLQ